MLRYPEKMVPIGPPHMTVGLTQICIWPFLLKFWYIFWPIHPYKFAHRKARRNDCEGLEPILVTWWVGLSYGEVWAKRKISTYLLPYPLTHYVRTTQVYAKKYRAPVNRVSYSLTLKAIISRTKNARAMWFSALERGYSVDLHDFRA